MYKTFSMELAGRTLSVDVGRVGAQANGCAFMHYGETTVLSTATASEKPRDGIDFFPLSVEYEEKLYAVGKIPGGFNKREGKASENAVLTSRVIDRPMRPLFPKDYRNDVTLNNLVMSVDPACRPELVAMLGSAIATSISDIPFCGPCATTQIGMIDGELIVNPSQEQWKNGDLNLTVASTSEKVIMIEAGANEVSEEDFARKPMEYNLSVSEEIKVFSRKEFRDFLNSIADSYETPNPSQGRNFKSVYKYEEDGLPGKSWEEYTYYYLLVRFEENSNIVWLTELYHEDGELYFTHGANQYEYCALGSDYSQMICELIGFEPEPETADTPKE